MNPLLFPCIHLRFVMCTTLKNFPGRFPVGFRISFPLSLLPRSPFPSLPFSRACCQKPTSLCPHFISLLLLARRHSALPIPSPRPSTSALALSPSGQSIECVSALPINPRRGPTISASSFSPRLFLRIFYSRTPHFLPYLVSLSSRIRSGQLFTASNLDRNFVTDDSFFVAS